MAHQPAMIDSESVEDEEEWDPDVNADERLWNPTIYSVVQAHYACEGDLVGVKIYALTLKFRNEDTFLNFNKDTGRYWDKQVSIDDTFQLDKYRIRCWIDTHSLFSCLPNRYNPSDWGFHCSQYAMKAANKYNSRRDK